MAGSMTVHQAAHVLGEGEVSLRAPFTRLHLKIWGEILIRLKCKVTCGNAFTCGVYSQIRVLGF